MDCILIPDNVLMHMLVPDLGGPEYDNQGFQGYDERQGWNIAPLRNGDFAEACDRFFEFAFTVTGDISPDDLPENEAFVSMVVGAFIQTGILSESYRKPQGPDGQVTSIKQITLQTVSKEFLGKEDERKADAAWASQFTRCLQDAAAILMDLDFLLKFGGYIVPMPVHLALSVLVQSLNYYRVIFPRQQSQLGDNYFHAECRAFELKLLNDGGWCPNVTRRIFSSLGLGGLYYATLLPGFGLCKGRNKCDMSAGVTSNINHDKYEVIHD
ncbi:uncharacterized protein Z519_09184 [Cladophialophora bantiana CBS 173.52]|uniref:Uncharacterized protein n=1 Tax=Cladophialophora bantiana (strain ATCC 10958 / CBS 173.52 / CDC B-1940 / NIH 8579) TaxID=1442370 RepID=A0A0D2FVI0_CLAB1|nr:uncharacterized protein Z519_09184 [Cladophialophora bantiana CBS 173.52]KIW90537.1 hypothetical protein Z519_09184 [Cladophialophora bantiana CBS 173.52]